MPSNALTSTLFLLLLFAGALACVWLMMLLTRRELYATDSTIMRQMRRGSLACIACGMLWTAKFYSETSWSPWPPCILIVLGIDVFLIISIISAHQRIRAKAQRTDGVSLSVFHR